MRRALSRLDARPGLTLSLLVVVGFLIRLGFVWGKQEPLLLPDEYIYVEISRGFFAGIDVRDASWQNFLPLLEPLLTWPFWASLEPLEAYRAVQGFHSLLFALTAVPVYALAGRLGLSARWSLVCAALTLAIPDLVYTGFTSSEALGYLLFVTWVWAAVVMLATPNSRSALLLLVLTALAIGARMQMVILPLSYLLVVFAQAITEKDIRGQLRRQAACLIPLLVLGMSAAVVKGSGALGSYAGVVNWWERPLPLLEWMGRDLYALMWNSGLVLLPGCLIAVAYALWRPERRETRAFALLFCPLVLLFLVEGAYYSADAGSPYFLEAVHSRYFFYLCPLVFIGFALYAARPRAQAALALLSLAAIASVHYLPLSSLASASASYSPLLQGVLWFERVLGGPFRARPYLFLLATLLFLILVLLRSRAPRLMAPVAAAAAMLLLGISSFGAHDTVNRYSSAVTKNVFGSFGPGWVKRLNDESAVLVPAGTERSDVEVLGYWRPSLRFALLPGAGPPDAFSYEQVSFKKDGTVLVAGKSVSGTVTMLTESAAVEATVTAATDSTPAVTLWRTAEPLRLRQLTEGYYRRIGWLADKGLVRLWPTEGKLAGYLELRLSKRAGTARLILDAPGYRKEQALASAPPLIRVPVCSNGPWTLFFRVDSDDLLGGATLERGFSVSAKTPPPRFVPDASACD